MSAWASDSPLAPTSGGALEGEAAWAWGFLILAAAALAAYVAGLVLLGRVGAPLAAVATVAVAMQVAPLAGPLLLSSDAWTYWMYARIAAVHGDNPYEAVPADYRTDPAFEHMGSAWHETSSVYGPAFTLASEAVARSVGSSEDAAAWVFKALGALAMLVATAAAARASPRPWFAAAFVGWNPVVALHAAGGGHNDAWMAALVAAALALAVSGRRQLAGAAWVAATAVKWVPLVLWPLQAVADYRRGRSLGLAGAAAAAVVVAVLATWRYGTGWLGALEPVARKAGDETSYALPSRLAQLGIPQQLAAGLLAAGFAVAYLLLLRSAWRGRPRLALASALLLLASPWLVVWYLAWPVALAAAEDDRRAQLLVLVLCGYLLPQAVPL